MVLLCGRGRRVIRPAPDLYLSGCRGRSALFRVLQRGKITLLRSSCHELLFDLLFFAGLEEKHTKHHKHQYRHERKQRHTERVKEKRKTEIKRIGIERRIKLTERKKGRGKEGEMK